MISLYHRSLPMVLALMIGLCAVATSLSFLGAHHWGLALFANLPLQLTGALGLLGGVCLLTENRRLARFAFLVLLPSLWQLSYYYWPRSYSDEAPSLRVQCFNVQKSNPNHAAVLEHLQTMDADIIALIEVNGTWLEEVSPLEKTYPHVAHLPNNHNFGIALYSKYPVIKFQRPMPTPGHPLLIAQIDYQGHLLNVVVAHPVPPMSRAGAEFWERYLRFSIDQVARLNGPTLFMGDFNASPWSHLFPSIIKTTGLQDSGRGRGFQSTWNRYNPFFTAPIDHIFHSPELRPTARSIGPSNGSDHSPVTVDFAFHPTLPVPKAAPKPTPPGIRQHPAAPPIRHIEDPGKKPRVRRIPDKGQASPEAN